MDTTLNSPAVAYQPPRLPQTARAVEKLSRLETIVIAGLVVEHSIPATKVCALPLVFVPGMWSTGKMFRILMYRLSELGFECFAPTLIGKQNIGANRIGDYVADVERLLNELGQPVILIGHSMGSLIANRVATHLRQLVAAEIGLTSAPATGIFISAPAMMRLPRYLLKVIFGALFSKPLSLNFADAKALLFNRTLPEDLTRCYEEMRPESARVALEILLGFRLIPATCPSLIVGGTFDNFTPNQKPVARRIRAEYAKVPCSHMVMSDPNSRRLVELLDQWIRTKLPNAFEPPTGE